MPMPITVTKRDDDLKGEGRGELSGLGEEM